MPPALFVYYFHLSYECDLQFLFYSVDVDVDMVWIVDVKKPNDSRMFFSEQEGSHVRNSTIRLDVASDSKQCFFEDVYFAV